MKPHFLCLKKNFFEFEKIKENNNNNIIVVVGGVETVENNVLWRYMVESFQQRYVERLLKDVENFGKIF